jgi:outer membrane protein assembly factor BamB
VAARNGIIIAVIVVIIVIGLAAGLVFLTSSSTTTSITTSNFTSTTSQSSTSFSFTTQSSTYTTFTPGGNYSSSYLTYHRDLVHDGYDPDEPAYQAPGIAWVSPTLDGASYGEPLVYNGLVYAVTENDSVYALNEFSGGIVWRENLGTPVPANTLPCGDIDPSGITSTPVIDPATSEIFVVAYLYPPQHHVLFALNLQTGSIVFQRIVDPPGVSPLVEQQRGSLELANHAIYIPYGGLAGDCGQYHGYVLGVHEDNSSVTLSYAVPSVREAGIWAPSGVSIDSTGVFVATGNSGSNSAFDFGNAVIHLSFGLNETDYFAPTSWEVLNVNDTDLGSVSPTLLGNNTIFQIGKQGIGYLLNEANLGGIGGEEFSLKVCQGSIGGTAYFAGVIYIPCYNGLFAVKAQLSPSPTFTNLWNNTNAAFGPPIIAGGVIWTLDSSHALYALALNNGTKLFSSTGLGGLVHFETPSSANGLIFAAGNDVIYAFSI